MRQTMIYVVNKTPNLAKLTIDFTLKRRTDTYRLAHFFFPFDFDLDTGAGLDDATLEARDDGAADVALLPAPDLTLSSALFFERCQQLTFYS